MVQGGIPASTAGGKVSYSTLTVTGTGNCFSADNPTLVVDCTNHKVGIGTAIPATKLSVYGIITSSTTQGTASVGTISATCTDQHCTLTPGAVSAVTYTFGTAWPNNIPDCVALTNAAVPLALSVTAVSKTALTITSGAALTGDTVTFMCMGAP